MPWSIEQKLDYLMRLPWTVRPPTKDADEGYLIARVDELEDVIATGDNEKELGADLWDALRSSLSARLAHDDAIPLPEGVALLWDLMPDPPATQVPYRAIQMTPRSNAVITISSTASSKAPESAAA